MKTSTDEELSRRFYILNTIVAIILLAAIFVSISQFGAQAWQGQRQIALVIPGEKNQLGWNKSQYTAAKKACDELNFDLVIRENVSSDADACRKVADELSKRGVNAIVFANGCLLRSIIEFEKVYPKIKFSTIESISVLHSGGRYSILSYEASYLAGILAGLHTKTNKIGYVAPFMNPEVNQGINAFTMGVQRVNPKAEVLINWTGSWNDPIHEEQAVQNLKAEHVDFLTYHQNGDTVPNSAERAGINFVAFNETYPSHSYCLAAIKIKWNEAYMDLIKYKDAHELKANYAFGINQGLIDFEILNNVTKREKVLIDTAIWEIEHGRLIFSGEIFDRNGVQKCAANETISLKNLQNNMNWLIKGVRIVGN
ncbi:MAG: BMP family ABC transporter substrate-binding protein [Selenomonadaceae bacterium]|nr:BMP family ABC transporter substrate-binding protein [Selenomonadaceae bacterium]MBR1858227.1 BMP family ABC transporter substrate-binding protein [Selenomonadaceae bacterium]